MASNPSFAPTVCVVGFHHARFGAPSTPERPQISETDVAAGVLRLRAGSASRRGRIQQPTMTGTSFPSWPLLMALTRRPSMLNYCRGRRLIDRGPEPRKTSPTSPSASSRPPGAPQPPASGSHARGNSMPRSCSIDRRMSQEVPYRSLWW